MNNIRKFDLGEIDSAEIKVVGDLHIGDAHFLPEMVHEFKAWLAAKPNRYYIIVGDLFNAATKQSVSDVYAEALSVDESMQMFCDLFSDIADRCLGVVSGNHDRRVYKEVGVDPVKWACNKIGVPYYGCEGNVVVALGNHRPDRTDRRRAVHYSLFLTHGVGGGRGMGGKANALKRLNEIVVADIYCQGHTHTPQAFASVVREYSSNYKSIVERRQVFAMTGASVAREGYAKAFCFPAVDRTWVTVEISGKSKYAAATI